MYDIKQDKAQITEQLFRAKEVEGDDQSQYPNSCYEEGVVAAFEWLFGDNPFPPIIREGDPEEDL